MHKEQEETEQSRKGNGRECPSSIEECAKQQHSESIMEQTYIDSLMNSIENVWTSDSETN